MKYVSAAVFIIVGLINFVPVVGVLSADRLTQLYNIAPGSDDIVIMLRHRAVLFGLLGLFIIAAAFKPSWRLAAGVAGLISMMAFVLIAFTTDGPGTAIRKIALIDVGASIALLAVMVLPLFSTGDH